MALKKCPECGHKVSSKASACPGCGAPIKRPTQYGCGTLLLVLLAVFVLFSLTRSCGGPGGETGERTSSQGIEGVGYFKDDPGNRVRTYSFRSSVTEASIRAHAQKLTSTSGRMMAAYYYPAGSVIPADGVTLAGTMVEATDVIFDDPALSKWRFAFMRYFNGSVEFVDCSATPVHDLCRK